MKQWFYCAILSVFCFALCGGEPQAPAGGGIRVDIIAPMELNADTGAGIHVSKRVRKSGSDYLYDLILTKQELSRKWSTFTFSLYSAKDTWAVIEIKGINGRKGHPVLHCSALKYSGTTVKNPDFEKLSAKGTLSDWGGTKEQAGKDSDAASPQSYARVAYDRPVRQRIRLKAGVQAGFTLKVRQEKEWKFSAPSGTHVAFDAQDEITVPVSSGRFEFIPSFENCSIYYTPTAREKGKRITVTPFYRKTGSSSWTPALPLADVRHEGVFRGSLLLLKENTDYEAKLEIKGEVNDCVTSSFRTRNSSVPVSKTIVLDQSILKDKTFRFQSGTPQGYIRYTMKPGEELKGLTEGDGNAILNLENVKYVILDGLTIKANMARRAIFLYQCEDVIIRNCDISDFGRTDNIRGLRLRGRWLYKGNETGWDGGIFISHSKNILIERCYIHDPRSTANSWLYSHPTGPEAIFMDRNKGGIVLRYCDLVGSDKKRWNDAVESSGNGDLDGGIGRDADICGNLFAFSNDDSIEIEGQEMNIRVYRNRFEGSYCGVSTGCCRMGPSYQFSNLYYRLSDENGRFGVPFKNGMGNQGAGSIYVFNNTVFSPGLSTAAGGFHNAVPQINVPLKAWFRNNILHTEKTVFDHREFRRWNTSLDYDLICGLPKAREAEAKKYFAETRKEQHALFGDPKFRSIENADFRLDSESPARNSAEQIPGLKLSDRGAFQQGSFSTLPYRPLEAWLSVNEVRFKEFDTAPRKILLSAGKNFKGGDFSLKLNDDFFTVQPSSGTLKPGKSLTFTITLHPEKMPMPKMYRGMALFRFADGLSRPLSIYADYRDSESRLKESEKHGILIPGPCVSKQKFVSTVKIPADGIYFLVGEGEIRGFSPVSVQIGDAVTNKSARFIGRTAPELRHCFGLVRRDHLSAWYFPLKAGVQKFSFQCALPGMKVKRFILTQTPEWFIR